MTSVHRNILFIAWAIFVWPLLATATEDTADNGTRFVIDKLYVSLRQSADENSPIVTNSLVSGTQLTLIEEDKVSGYSQVATSSGTRGWLKTRYLQRSPTASLKVASLEKQLIEAIGKDKGDFQKELQETRAQLDTANERQAKLEKELAEIRHASGNVIKISEQNKELIEKNQLLQSKLDSLEAVSDQYQDDQSMTFFIYGGLLVLATLIVNMMIDSIKRKRSYGSGGW